MADAQRKRLAAEVDAETLNGVRRLAVEEGRPLRSLVDEALTDLLEKRRQMGPRDHVMRAYRASHEPYASLYKKLAQ